MNKPDVLIDSIWDVWGIVDKKIIIIKVNKISQWSLLLLTISGGGYGVQY